MAVELKLAKLGPEMESALLIEWLVGEGEEVSAGQPVATVETDKVTTDLEAPAAGPITGLAEVDAEYEVGAVLARIGAGDAATASDPAPAETAQSPAETAQSPAETAPAAVAETASATPAQTPPAAPGAKVRATPLARRVAAQLGVDLGTLAAAEGGKPLRKRHVLAAAERSAPAASAPTTPVPAFAGSAEKLSPMRRRIAQRMVASLQETAQITDFREHDVTDFVRLRAEGSRWARALGAGGLGFTDLFVRATVLALAEVPELNASLDAEGRFVKHPQVNLGLAVAVPEGLIVPVLQGAEALSLVEVHERVVELVGRAREGSLGIEQLAGGTFTLSNIGSYGSQMATPILVSGQVGILAVGSFLRRPLVRGERIEIGTAMHTSLTIDHRLVDGETAGRFQNAIAALLSEPERLL